MQNRFMYGARGYLDIVISGEETLRFLNICRNHGIEIWKIRKDDGTYRCRMYAGDFLRIKPIAFKTHTKVSVRFKRGLPFIIRIIIRFKILTALLCLLIFMLIYSNNFVWSIEYEGNLQVSDDELGDFIKSEGIYYGARIKDIDCEAQEKNIRARFDNFIWCSVYFEGTKLYISVKENEMPTPISVTPTGKDIVANDDGVITSILVRNGLPMVSAGEEVTKGQVLVSGSVPVYNEDLEVIGYQVYDADADIYIQTEYEIVLSVESTYYLICYTGSEFTSGFLQAFGYGISNIKATRFIFEKKNMSYETTTYRRQFCLFENFYLPAYYGKIYRKEYYVKYLTYTDDEMQEKLTEDLKKIILSLQEKGIKIVEKNVKMVQNRSGMELNGNLVIIKNIID